MERRLRQCSETRRWLEHCWRQRAALLPSSSNDDLAAAAAADGSAGRLRVDAGGAACTGRADRSACIGVAASGSEACLPVPLGRLPCSAAATSNIRHTGELLQLRPAQGARQVCQLEERSPSWTGCSAGAPAIAARARSGCRTRNNRLRAHEGGRRARHARRRASGPANALRGLAQRTRSATALRQDAYRSATLQSLQGERHSPSITGQSK